MSALLGVKIMALSALLAAVLTEFYFIHENLPKFVRAPTSLILAPVAIVDGLCYALGVNGIYGKPVPIFLVNWGVGLAVCVLIVRFSLWRQRRQLVK